MTLSSSALFASPTALLNLSGLVWLSSSQNHACNWQSDPMESSLPYAQLTPVTDRHTPVLSEKSLELLQFFRCECMHMYVGVCVYEHMCVDARRS